MIDIHSHILFGVDDGCKTIDESLLMIKKAIDAGVTDLFLTPHYAPKRGYEVSLNHIRDKFINLKAVVNELKLPIKLYLGQEIDEIKGLEDLIHNNCVLTLNESNYVLLDFGMNETNIDDYVYNLKIAGYVPIIAHPERYRYIESYELYHQWKSTGALIQINASSIFHPKTKEEKKKVNYLIKHKLVDYVASDTHRNHHVYQDLERAYRLMDKKGIRLKDFPNIKS